MNLRTALLALPLALVFAASFAAVQPETAVAASTGWSAQLDATLKASLEGKKGLVFHVAGESIPGGVKEIGGDYVIVANEEHSRILIRLDRIDAVAAN